ncbi:FG-GAP repeat domain-containing protein, partial [Micromonospora sp. DT231]|uniref:FG-GAP repeat domain-containing protein n=1 Tax=Micromonospora sp. DT231 TaxID=3416526 RepID=UPI003CF3B76B
MSIRNNSEGNQEMRLFGRKTSTLTAASLAVSVMLAAVLGNAAAVSAAPPTPDFGKSIDGYASYDGQDTCDPTAKPGVVAFKNLLNATYRPHSYGIGRACNDGGTSEHKEGRALDYMLDVNNSGQRATATDILNWLLATDKYGNKHANARRLGIMYLIWNRQIWKSYESSAGWQTYSCDGSASGCHTNHIHFSFSWAGARKQTSWWTVAPLPPTIGGTVGDVSGDGHADALGVQPDGTLWYYPNNMDSNPGGKPFTTRTQVGTADWQKFTTVMSADVSGDGHADALGVKPDGTMWYYPNNMDSNAGGKPFTTVTQVGEDWQQFSKVMAADVSGDGHADALGVKPDGTMWYYPNNMD